MKRLLILYLIMCLGIAGLHAETGATIHVVDCGTWMELTATPAEDFHFVEWSDGNTDSVRQIQVNENALYIAYFAANCEEYANWPVEIYYDWLVMLNVRKINEMGYFISPQQVSWYRVIGEPDDMHNVFPQDDQKVCSGYYLTIAQNLLGTGDYYAVADASDNQGKLCDGLMRSVIVHFSGNEKKQKLGLIPNRVSKGDVMQLKGLKPNEKCKISVYDSVGKLIETYICMHGMSIELTAPGVAGCYMVRVQSDSYNEVLRFIVSH